MTQTRFDTVLIANRGEIAVRIIGACHRLGLRTVAVYSEADHDALHVRLADQAVAVGPAPAALSYLDGARLIAAAGQSGAQAIHPGYGFLSENADFARAVVEAGLVYIGPAPDSIAAMANKSAAKQRMLAAGVPCVPGYAGADQSDAAFVAAADQLGFPLMIKAAAGGGGRGMRLVESAAELPSALAAARAEALAAFGDGQLLLERALVNARHIEIQIFGDQHGGLIHLGERECSLQRRHQKLIEEAPSTAVDEELRGRLGATALAAARSVAYVGAGTVEFLLDATGAFYFLEINTRLQVEHAVTELVYGVDLVEWQLRIAGGEKLPMDQQQVLARRRGWAIEARLCAEDPALDFRPQSGPLLVWQAPELPGTRIDHGLIEGQRISPHYDSLQAKLIAHGDSRELARTRLLQLLEQTVLLGVSSNRDFLHALLAHPQFVAGALDTGFIGQHFPPAALRLVQEPPLHYQALAALVLYRLDAQALCRDAGFDPELSGWHSAAGLPTRIRLACADRGFEAAIDGGDQLCISNPQGPQNIHLRIQSIDERHVVFLHEGARASAHLARDGRRLWLQSRAGTWVFDDRSLLAPAAIEAVDDGRLRAPMDGRIIAVQTTLGAVVRKGETLLVLEAMKMQLRLEAGRDGVVQELLCQPQQQVRARALLLVLG